VARTSKQTGIIRYDVNITLNIFLDEIALALMAGKNVTLKHLGTLCPRMRKPKIVNDMLRNLRVPIPARIGIRFIPSKKLLSKSQRSP